MTNCFKKVTSMAVAGAIACTMGMTTFASEPTTEYEAIVCCGDNFPDSLSASTLADASDLPLYLVREDYASATKEAMTNDGIDGKIYIIGGVNAISDSVANSLGFEYTRLGGETRYETNYLVQQEALKYDEHSDYVTNEDFEEYAQYQFGINDAQTGYIETLDEKVDAVDVKVDNLTDRVDSVEGTVSSLREELENFIETVETKLSEVWEHITGVESDVDDINTTVDDINGSYAEALKATAELEAKSEELTNSLEELKAYTDGKSDSIQSELDELKNTTDNDTIYDDSEVQDKLADLYEKINGIKLEEGQTVNVEELQAQLDDYNNTIEDLKERLEAVELRNDSLEIAELKAKLVVIEAECNELGNSVEAINVNINPDAQTTIYKCEKCGKSITMYNEYDGHKWCTECFTEYFEEFTPIIVEYTELNQTKTLIADNGYRSVVVSDYEGNEECEYLVVDSDGVATFYRDGNYLWNAFHGLNGYCVSFLPTKFNYQDPPSLVNPETGKIYYFYRIAGLERTTLAQIPNLKA